MSIGKDMLTGLHPNFRHSVKTREGIGDVCIAGAGG